MKIEICTPSVYLNYSRLTYLQLIVWGVSFENFPSTYGHVQDWFFLAQKEFEVENNFSITFWM